MRHYLPISLTLMIGLWILFPKKGWSQKSYYLDAYQVQMELLPDGKLKVSERLGFQFEGGDFTYAFRKVKNSPLDSISQVEVSSPSVALTKIKQEGNTIRWEFAPRRAPATFTISYLAHGVLEADDGRNRLDWWAIGKEWDVPVENVEVELSLPFQDLSPDSLELAPGTAQMQSSQETPLIRYEKEKIEPGEGFEFTLSFPQRIDVPESMRSKRQKAFFWCLGLAILGILAGVAARERNPKGDAPSHLGPPGLSIDQAGYLAFDEDSQRTRLFHGMLFDLAQRGHLRLHRGPKKWGQEKVEAEVLPHQGQLSDREERFLQQLERYPQLDKFGQHGSEFRQEVLHELRREWLEAGAYLSRRERSNRLLWGGAGLMVASIVALFVLPLSWKGPIGGLLLGGAFSLFIAGAQRYVFTPAGAQRKAEVKAYVRHLRREIDGLRNGGHPAEAARRLMQYLPWLLLDSSVDASWLNKIKKSLKDSSEKLELPDWLVDPTGQGTHDAVGAFIPMIAVFNSTGAAVGATAVGGGAAGAAGGGGGAG